MLRKKQPGPLSIFWLTQQLDRQYDQAKDKYQQAEPVDAVHITDPFTLWPAGIFLFKVEIFGYLF